MPSRPLAVVVKDRSTGRLLEYRGFAAAAAEPGYLEQLAKNSQNFIQIVPDTFLTQAHVRRTPSARALYGKPRTPVAALCA